MNTKQIEALRNRFGGSGSFPATYDDLTDLCDAVLAVLAPAASEPAPHIPLRTHTSLGPGEILIGSAADAVRIVNVAEPVRKSFICNAGVRCKGGTVIAPCVFRPGHYGDHCAEPRLPAPVEPEREAFPPGRGWRCEACGEMAEDVPDTAWRWAGDRYQHSHGQAGHFDARFFGDPAREAEPTITTYCAGCIDLRARLDCVHEELSEVVYEDAAELPGAVLRCTPELPRRVQDLRARLAAATSRAERAEARVTEAERRVEELERLAFNVADGIERGLYGSHTTLGNPTRKCQCSLCALADALAKRENKP